MQKLLSNYIFRVLLVGSLLFFGIQLLHNSLGMLEDKFSENITFSQSGFLVNSNLSGLETGSYLFSLGRPRAFCDILFNDDVIFKGKNAINGIRHSLMVSAPFKITKNKSNLLLVDCDSEAMGFGNKFFHKPKIFKYHIGQIFLLIKQFIEVLMAPFLALSLIGVYLFSFVFYKSDRNTKYYSFFVSSFVVLLYSMSLSYVTRMFFDGEVATLFHIIVRTLASLSIFYMLRVHSTINKYVYVSHGAAFLLTIYMMFTSGIQSVISLYPQIYPIYFISSLILVYINIKNRSTEMIVYASIIWSLAQGIWYIKHLDFIKGAYSFPVVLATFIGMLAAIKAKEIIFKNKIMKISREITDISSKLKNPKSFMYELANILNNYSPFELSSVYIDSYLLNDSLEMRKVYTRISSKGYDEDRDKTFEKRLYLSNVSGKHMKDAFKQEDCIEQLKFKNGDEGIIFTFDNFSAFNFSSHGHKSRNAINEFVEVLRYVDSRIKETRDYFLSFYKHKFHGFEFLKSNLDSGFYKRYVGSLFCDIDDYSINVARFGNNFSDFVNNIYLPELSRYISNLALPEEMKGDEVRFFTTIDLANLKDKSSEFEEVKDLINNAVLKVKEFQEDKGRILCSRYGYPNITMKVGASLNEGSITIDEFSVRVSSISATYAARYLDAASSNSIIIDSSLIDEKFYEVKNKLQGLKVKKSELNCYVVGLNLDEKRSA